MVSLLHRLLLRFVHRLKRIPPFVVTVGSWLRTVMIGPRIPPNPYYLELRAIQKRGNVTSDDVEHVIVPLLVMRGDEIAVLRHELRHAMTRGTVLYGVVVILLVFGALLVGQIRDLSTDNRTALHRLDDQAAQIRSQQREADESRRIGRATNCAIQSSVIKAAIFTITQSVKQPPKFDRNLVRLGFPNEAQRRVAARRTARGYALLISRAVEKAARDASPSTSPARPPVNIGPIVKKDGTLDCAKLAALSTTDPRAQSGP